MFSRSILFINWLIVSFLSLASNPKEGDKCESLAVGGQAVMEGIMMRNGAKLALAIRKPDGNIIAIRRDWKRIFSTRLTGKKWFRGFPILAETLVNGIKALNISAEVASGPDEEKIKPWQLALSLILALALALLFFVVIPHVLTIGLGFINLASSVEGLSFHLWDGLLKILMFVGYILAISQMEDIRRVFQYHGTEHKSIAAYEGGENPVTPANAAGYSRVHPRCGTTFMLFVLVISILIHAITVPAFLWLWTPKNVIVKHIVILIFKFFLIIPISALAYEAIRKAALMSSPFLGFIFRSPGLLLQLITTREPDYQELEVGLVALKEALGENTSVTIETPAYEISESF